MSYGQILNDAMAPLIDFVFPPRCPACGDAIGKQSGLCIGCWGELAIPGEPACALCQIPFPESGPGEGALCAPCLARRPIHDGIAAATLYNAVSRKLVLAMKHGRRIALATMMAKLILARLPECSEQILIVPVPLHRWRLWRRGYNQAALLGRELERLGVGTLIPDLLERKRHTPPLGGYGAKARRKLLKGAIALSKRGQERVAGADIVLVDDVLTSGATSEACVKLLKRHGARSVRIACFARVIGEAAGPDSIGAFRKSETPGANTTPGAS